MKRRTATARGRSETAAPSSSHASIVDPPTAFSADGEIDPAASERDIAAIKSFHWPHRTLGNIEGFRDDHFQVVFHQSVLDEIHLHGQSITDIEVCGVLIGTGYNDPHGPYLLVEHCIRGLEARGHSTNVTFTAETWQHIQGVMDRDFPDKKMVGWYHTHPGFGIFLSGMDQFICENFFNLPWQAAFVYDPKSGEEGNFVWRSGKTKREPILIEDDVTPKAASIPLMSVAEATSTAPVPMVDNEKIIELLTRVRRLEKRQKLLIIAMVFMVAFVLMWAYGLQPIMMPAANKPTTVPAALTSTPAPVKPAAPGKRSDVPQITPQMPDPTTQPML